MDKKNKKNIKPTPSDAEAPQVFAVEIDEGKARFTRREFLVAAGIATTAAALAGCEQADTSGASATILPSETTPPAAPTPMLTATPAPTLDPDQLVKCGVARAHKGKVDSLVISMDRSLLVSSGDETIKVWLLPYGALFLTLEWGETFSPRKIMISPDNRYLVAGSDDLIKVWSLPDGVLRHTLDANGRAIAISPDSTTLAEGVGEKMIRLWSLSDGKLTNTIETKRVVYAHDLLYSPDGSSLIVIDTDKIGVLSYPDGALIQTLAEGERIFDADINLDGSLLALDKEYGVQVWSLLEGALLHTIEVDTDSFSKPAINADGSLLVVGSGLNNQTIERWSLPDGKRLRSLMHSPDGHSRLAVSPDGTLLASGGRNGTIKLWSLPEGEPVSCPIDLVINNTNVQGLTYEVTNDAGGARTVTLPCGSPIPEGAVCTCNCVAGGMCSCVGHSCSCDGHSTGTHYWYPN